MNLWYVSTVLNILQERLVSLEIAAVLLWLLQLLYLHSQTSILSSLCNLFRTVLWFGQTFQFGGEGSIVDYSIAREHETKASI